VSEVGVGRSSLAGLRRFLERRPAEGLAQRCEFCSEALAEEHSHVVKLEPRAMVCACRACWLLFTPEGAGGQKYRAVPARYTSPRGPVVTESRWDELQIPVGMAFFFVNSALGRPVAFYPSPAGATESLLPLGTWADMEGADPSLGTLTPDVEALLVRKSDSGFECHIVPIDACYELVGRIRRRWKGFHGGEEAWSEIEAFFAGVREKSRPAPAAD
jgi:hypothetical protein